MLSVRVRIQTVDELENVQNEYLIPTSLELLQDPPMFGAYIAHAVEELRRKTNG